MIQTENSTAVKPNVRPSYYLKEYDDVMMGRRKTYSSALMTKEQGPYLCAELLKSIFTLYMHWTPEQVRDQLTPDVVKTMKLWPLVKRLPCPPELNPAKELYYVAWHLWPETRTVKTPELIIKLYTDILNENMKKFPSGYFDGNDGYIRARILFMTMVREFLPPFENLEAMYMYFASPAGKKCISKYKLTIPLRELYGSALAYLHDALPEWQRDDDLYEKYNAMLQKPRPSESPFLPVTDAEKAMLYGDIVETTGKDFADKEEEEALPEEDAEIVEEVI